MVAQTQKRTLAGSMNGGLGYVLRLREFSILVVAIIIAIVFQAQNSAFLSTDEIKVLLATTAQIGLIAAGETMLMITGEIDLSAAKIYSTTPFIAYYLTDGGLPFWTAIILALVGAALIGMVNGLITVRLRVPSLIATLGMLFLLNGATLWVSKSQPVLTPREGLVNTWLGIGQTNPTGGLADYAGFLWLAAAAIVLTVVLHRTRFGMHTIAVGSNLLAAREIGIRTDRTKIVNFMIMGVVAGLSGIIQAVASTSIDPSAGDNSITLYGIAAAVIGGTSLFGGSGTVIGTLIGAFVISMLNNGLPLVGAQANTSDTILGAAILVAVVFNVWLNNLRGRK
ncbi:MAG: ABC transporter permease [Chloroflexi bacterium]|nr:ABC transporter permease [Chloroflexota bacterium]